MEMEYRRLGNAGLKVSVLSFGSWVTFHNQLGHETALQCMQAARDAGVNFFDNAEVYAGGKSEIIMGHVARELGWPRESYVMSTKLYWGLRDGPNTQKTLNRKYLMQGIDGSLERLGLDYVDLLFCHRDDPETPVEEVVWAMSDIIASGKAHYWGTSEWPAEAIEEAYEIADRYRLRKPVMEQPQYSLLSRERVEEEYAPLYEKHGMGTTIWSPLASGALTARVPSRGSTWMESRPIAARRCRAMNGFASTSSRPTITPRFDARSRSRMSSVARPRNWRSPGAQRTPMSRPSSPARAASSNCTRTWARSR
jgi:voltage-dependent potassium channel beta subunit